MPMLLTVAQVAHLLNVSKNTVRAYMERGLPWVQLSSRRVAIDAIDLEWWLNKHKRLVPPSRPEAQPLTPLAHSPCAVPAPRPCARQGAGSGPSDG